MSKYHPMLTMDSKEHLKRTANVVGLAMPNVVIPNNSNAESSTNISDGGELDLVDYIEKSIAADSATV
jgi:hypothetical protein